MSPEEYSLLCDRILTETMKYITTDNMRKRMIRHTGTAVKDPVYISAATSTAPVTIAYTPVGSGKSALIADRVKNLMACGTPAADIAVLSMNIAKAKQTAIDLPGIRSMTFSDFTHELFTANRTGYELVDDTAITNTLKLQTQTPFIRSFLNILAINNPTERNSMLAVFMNSHTDEAENMLSGIRKISYTLESMVCQNQIYGFTNDPFCLEEIIINGVQNMPLHTLCCVLKYASVLGCRLFFTGMPDETIYEFNMAYGNAMNMLSAYMDRLDISVVRLPSVKMADSIQNTLQRADGKTIHVDTVKTDSIIIRSGDDEQTVLKSTVADACCDYIDGKLADKEQVLVIARSKSEINAIKSVILDHKDYGLVTVTDLTAMQPPVALWGTVMVKYAGTMQNLYPGGVNKILSYDSLWKFLSQEVSAASSKYMKDLYHKSQELLREKAAQITCWTQDDMLEKPVKVRIQEIIDEESLRMTEYNDRIKNDASMDLQKSGIIFSTIHSATDIRCDNVIVYLKNFSDKADENLHRIALSRANRTEYLIFANAGNFEIPVQRYLKHHLEQ